MSTQHTPTPWRTTDAYKEQGMRPIETNTATLGGVHTEADAEFIVRACNAHDALVAALRTIRAIIERPGVRVTPILTDIDRVVGAALAAATE